MLARTLFHGGVEVDCSRGLADAIRTTRELIANPAVPAIFEGVFEYHNVLVKVDILHRRRDGRWRLIEVKSTTDVRDHYIEDVGIQYGTLSRSGVDVASACLAHVNRNYVRDSEIDPRRFFRIRNLTRRVQRLQPKLTFQLRAAFTVLSMPEELGILPCLSLILSEVLDGKRLDAGNGQQPLSCRVNREPSEVTGNPAESEFFCDNGSCTTAYETIQNKVTFLRVRLDDAFKQCFGLLCWVSVRSKFALGVS